MLSLGRGRSGHQQSWLKLSACLLTFHHVRQIFILAVNVPRSMLLGTIQGLACRRTSSCRSTTAAEARAFVSQTAVQLMDAHVMGWTAELSFRTASPSFGPRLPAQPTTECTCTFRPASHIQQLPPLQCCSGQTGVQGREMTTEVAYVGRPT